jgi:Vacuolar-sorting-associated 13 protein C-terminal/Autophagy-related protein C terminal domain
VIEPVRGFQRSVQEMDASYLVDGVARGTLSLARHTVGGFADSAAMLAETFSKNMTVLTLDRRYAQKRDRGEMLRDNSDVNVASGLGSGVQKLVSGFLDGVTGVVKAPIRGAEKRGLEGFAKGVGKGLLGLLVKPIIGISDGFTDVMIGVKGTVDDVGSGGTSTVVVQIRPRRALYGREKAIRSYHYADAAACALMLRTRLAGEVYVSHLDMGDRVALMTVKRMIILGRRGEELLVLKLKHIASCEVRSVPKQEDAAGTTTTTTTTSNGSTAPNSSASSNNSGDWAILVVLTTPRSNGSEVEIISCDDKAMAEQLCDQLEYGRLVGLME